MTLLERIADWMTGGEYSALIHDNEKIIHDLTVITNTIETLRGTISRVQKNHDDLSIGFSKMHVVAGMRLDALQEIAAMETPSCAHIGKRMAKVAREALGDDT